MLHHQLLGHLFNRSARSTLKLLASSLIYSKWCLFSPGSEQHTFSQGKKQLFHKEKNNYFRQLNPSDKSLKTSFTRLKSTSSAEQSNEGGSHR